MEQLEQDILDFNNIKNDYILELQDNMALAQELRNKLTVSNIRKQNDEHVDKDWQIRLRDKIKYTSQKTVFLQGELTNIKTKLRILNKQKDDLKKQGNEYKLRKIIKGLVSEDEYKSLMNEHDIF